jgi:hypothetical protein
MNKKMPICLLTAGMLLLAVAASAEQDCGVFPVQRSRSEDKYNTCDECLQKHDRCEERCAAQGYTCTALGYDQHDNRQIVQGDAADQERQARRNAIRRCREQGLIDCEVERCTEAWQPTHDQARLCPDRPDEARDTSRHGRHRPPEPPSAPLSPPAVASWQHIKEQCLGKPYEKIAQQCGGNANFWHGIRCRVTWSDGRTEELGGQVDLTDPYGRKYCTRDTRPANFNCVNQCDNSPGPLITLPRP